MVRDAIQRKLQVIATYSGYRREMCPHLIGKSKNGVEQALFYQFGGRSSQALGPDGHPRNWRCIPLAQLSDITTRQGKWHSAPNHSMPQNCVIEVDVQAD
jgi:hypothetical protein